MYIKIICAVNCDLCKKIDLPSIIVKTIDYGVSKIEGIIKRSAINNDVGEQLKIFLKILALKQVESARECFHISDSSHETMYATEQSEQDK